MFTSIVIPAGLPYLMIKYMISPKDGGGPNPDINGLNKYPENPAIESSSSPGAHAVPNITVTTAFNDELLRI